MKFIVSNTFVHSTDQREVVILQYNNWDDFTYKTMFMAKYCDKNGNIHNIGNVKIGFVNMTGGKTIDYLPDEFQELPEDFFSLGQDEAYYENLSKFTDAKRREILKNLHDMAYNPALFAANEDDIVTRISLLRDISKFKVKYQFHRMSHGGARLTKYDFTYSKEQGDEGLCLNNPLSFKVSPDSNPPTNIHVLIGRNGTGKTTLLKNMVSAIRSVDNKYGKFKYENNFKSRFANVLCVAFSPFDDFSSLDGLSSSIPYSYIGLNKYSDNLLNNIDELFLEAFNNCMTNDRKRRLWHDSVTILKSDPTFAEHRLEAFVEASLEEDGYVIIDNGGVKSEFSKLSSGHKVVLLIITNCVDKIEEKSIVFMDEPENHLHPPLLSALIRALSNLLIDRNGVAIISTHSPIVLQEVPKSCVWTLRRSNNSLIPERLEMETFGAGIAQLSNEVFGFEVTNSGFHKILSDAVASGKDYDSIIEMFDDQLGDEARLHIRTLIALREDDKL